MIAPLARKPTLLARFRGCKQHLSHQLDAHKQWLSCGPRPLAMCTDTLAGLSTDAHSSTHPQRLRMSLPPLPPHFPHLRTIQVDTVGDAVIVAGALMHVDEDGFVAFDFEADVRDGARNVIKFAQVVLGFAAAWGTEYGPSLTSWHALALHCLCLHPPPVFLWLWMGAACSLPAGT